MERTYKVLIYAKVKGKEKILSFPCRGHSPLNGEEALKIMESYAARRSKVKVIALTPNDFSATGYEMLDLKEMRELVV